MSRQHHRQEDVELRREVLIAAQLALLGEISPAIRGITLDWDAEQIRMRAITDGEPTDHDKASMEAAGTEIVAAFPQHDLAVEVIRVDAPDPLEPHNLNAWVYRRKER